MALTRKFLSALGIESDKIDEIIEAHAATVDGLKEERDKIKAEAEKYKADAEKLPQVQKELEDFKDESGNNPFEAKYNTAKEDYDKLKKEFDDFKSETEAKATQQAKESAYKNLLKEAGVSEKRIDSVLRVSDLSSVELDKDGKIKDADNLKKSIEEEWSDFIQKEHMIGTTTPNPIGGKLEGPKTESRAAKIAAQYHNNLYGENSTKEDK